MNEMRTENPDVHAAISENIRDRARELREDLRDLRADFRATRPRAAAGQDDEPAGDVAPGRQVYCLTG